MRLAFLLMVVIWPICTHAEDNPRQIVVQATGSASAAPDMAMVSVGVTHEARTAADAMRGVSDAATSVLAKITSAGIEDKDVQTSSLNLNPVWDHGNDRTPRIRGYSASTQLAVRVRELDELGGLLDVVVGEGANTLNSLEFAFSEPAPMETAAREDAVKKARAKAETLASAAGVSLGPVQSIREGGSGGGGHDYMMRGAMMESASVPIAAGEMDVQVGVTVVFAIAD